MSYKPNKYKLHKLEDMVRAILEEFPETRDNDRVLTVYLHRDYYGVNPWGAYMATMLDDRLPTQESIGRCRRKIQATDFSLRGSRAKDAVRMAEQEIYIDYALEAR